MAAERKAIFVTQPDLPPLEEFLPYLEKIWQSKWLTNNGAFHQELERALCAHLGVAQLSLFANGTLALLTALQTLRITGEVITTPFSFPATAHALLWNGLQPVFVDIDPRTMNLDPALVEAAITPRTSAILPVHCYGNPCDVHSLRRIADVYGLKVIYDAAHAFGVEQGGQSILVHGDLSVLSFHATKVFTTFEGGAIVSGDARTKQRIDFLKNFGFADELTVVAPGINGKMNEFQAALGLLQLKRTGEAIERRRQIDARYRAALGGVPGISCLEEPEGTRRNYAYFPVLVGPDYPLTRDQLYQRLKDEGVFTRRYFHPLLTTLPMYRSLPSAAPERLRCATRVAAQVLCLPIYPALALEQVEAIAAVIGGDGAPGSG